MHWGNYRLFLSSIFAFALHLVDGCGRTPARPKPTPSTLPPHDRTTRGPPTTYGPNKYQLPCSKADEKLAACLNGGKCFALELVGVRSAHCTCPEEWTGKRCERLDGNFFILPADTVETAGIATGVVAVVIILTIVIVYVVIKRRRARKIRQRERAQNNGYVCKSLIQDGANVEYSPPDYTFIEKSETNV